jgi:hypothetical protein
VPVKAGSKSTYNQNTPYSMAELKTQENNASVEDYINGIGDEKVIADCNTLVNLMEKATGAPAKMWGDKIIGFGKYQYKSAATGKGGDWFVMGFAPRKAGLALYLMSGYTPEVKDCLTRLGKHKLSGSCIHITKLINVDVKVLEEMINEAAKVGPKYAA